MIKIFNNSYDLIKSFRWNSLFFKYWKILTILFLIPFIVIAIFVYIYYTEFASSDTRAQTITNFIKTENIFNNMFSEIGKNCAILNLNPSAQTYLTLPKSSLHTFENSNLTADINRNLQNFMITTNYLDSVYVFSTRHDYVISQIQSCDYDNFHDKTPFEWYKKTNSGNFILPRYSEVKGRTIISVSFELTDMKNVVIGLMVFNIDAIKLNEWFDSNIEHVYLYDSKGDIIYSNVDDKVDVLEDVNIERSNDMVITRKENSLNISKYLSNRSLILTVKDNGAFYKSTFMGRILFTVLLLIMSIFTPIIISFFLSTEFYKSIAKIVTSFHDYDIGEVEFFDEIAFINKNIMDMVKNKESIEKELVKKIMELKKSQAIALHTQLNSHFLFNTLNSIGVLAFSDRANTQLDILIKRLSDILHYSLNSSKYIVFIYNEIEYTKRYIDIEEIKFQKATSENPRR